MRSFLLRGVINHIKMPRMDYREQLITRIEEVAKAMGLQPSTVGERCQQGGQFYARLKSGKRVWPETASKVMDRLNELSPSQQPPRAE